MHTLPCRPATAASTPGPNAPVKAPVATGRERTQAAKASCRVRGQLLAWLVAGPALLACGLGCNDARSQTLASAGAVAPLAGRSAAAPGRLQLELAHGAHVFYEPKPWQPADPAPSAAGGPPPRASLGLGFRTAPSGAAGMRGLLKVQLSSDSALHFRPRGGGMTVTYRSQF